MKILFLLIFSVKYFVKCQDFKLNCSRSDRNTLKKFYACPSTSHDQSFYEARARVAQGNPGNIVKWNFSTIYSKVSNRTQCKS